MICTLILPYLIVLALPSKQGVMGSIPVGPTWLSWGYATKVLRGFFICIQFVNILNRIASQSGTTDSRMRFGLLDLISPFCIFDPQ